MAPTNGQVIQMGLLLRDTAIYSCNSGYVLNGDATVVCQANAGASWSGTTQCLGMNSSVNTHALNWPLYIYGRGSVVSTLCI